jgi:hypothetical protein
VSPDPESLHRAFRAIRELHRAKRFGGRWCCQVCTGWLYPCRTLRELYAALGMAWRGWVDGEGIGGLWSDMSPAERALSHEVNQLRPDQYWTNGIGVAPPAGWRLSDDG